MRLQITLRTVAIITLFCIQEVASATIISTPLEKFDFESLILVGTAKTGKNWIACISAPDGKIYVAKRHDYVGQQFAYIASIGAKSVTVNEKFLMNGSEWYERRLVWPITFEKKYLMNCSNLARTGNN